MKPRGSIPKLTVYETLSAGSPNDMVPAIRNILGGFLFSGDDVHKKVAVLSGGERTRLAVARMLLRPSNTLLLDEPTNHLDLDSKDILLEALEDFGGTLIFVSHDRYFVEKLATKIVEIGHGGARGVSRHLHGVSVEQGAIGQGDRCAAAARREAARASASAKPATSGARARRRRARETRTATEPSRKAVARARGAKQDQPPSASATRSSRSARRGSPISKAESPSANRPSGTSKRPWRRPGFTRTAPHPSPSSTGIRP